MTELDNGTEISGLGRHALWTYVDLAATSAALLLTTTIVLRELGTGAFGVVALLTTVAALIATAENGLTLATIRAAAREHRGPRSDREELRAELAVTHALYIAVGVGCGVLLVGFALTMPALIDSTLSASSIIVTGLAFAAGTALELGTSALPGMAAGRSMFRELAIAAVVRSAVTVVVLVAGVGPIGLPVVGLAQLAGVMAGRVVLWVLLHRSIEWFRLRPERPTTTAVRAVGRSVGPLVLLNVGGQIIAAADLLFLGAFADAAVLGLYRLGSLIPTQAIGVLYRGYDVALPALAGASSEIEQERITRLLTRVGAYVGGAGLMILALTRHDVVLLLNGETSRLAADIMLLFVAIWLTTLTAHGLALLIIARGKQRRMLPIIVGEIALNVPLTLALVIVVGPRGAAVATLATLALSHLFALPWLARGELQQSLVTFLALDAWSPIAVGAALASLAFLPFGFMAPSAGRLVLSAVFCSAVTGLAGAALLRRTGRAMLMSLLRSSPLAA